MLKKKKIMDKYKIYKLKIKQEKHDNVLKKTTRKNKANNYTEIKI
jgi:hypothetical protein